MEEVCGGCIKRRLQGFDKDERCARESETGPEVAKEH